MGMIQVGQNTRTGYNYIIEQVHDDFRDKKRLLLTLDDPFMDHVVTALVRAINLWPDAPWELKEFVDVLQYGKPMQDYESQTISSKVLTPYKQGVPEMSSVLHAAKQPATLMPPTNPAVKTIEQEHEDLVRNTKKDPHELMNQLTPQKMDALHMAVGIAGESGEVLDAVKKWVIYNQPLDWQRRSAIIEELGDLEYYLQGLRMVIGVSREEILDANLAKLRKRYPNEKYTDAAAKARADGATEFSSSGVIGAKNAEGAIGKEAVSKSWNTAVSGQANFPANSNGQPIDSSRC